MKYTTIKTRKRYSNIAILKYCVCFLFVLPYRNQRETQASRLTLKFNLIKTLYLSFKWNVCAMRSNNTLDWIRESSDCVCVCVSVSLWQKSQIEMFNVNFEPHWCVIILVLFRLFSTMDSEYIYRFSLSFNCFITEKKSPTIYPYDISRNQIVCCFVSNNNKTATHITIECTHKKKNETIMIYICSAESKGKKKK